VNYRNRTAPATLPPASGDDRGMPSLVIELDRHPVGAVHLDTVDRRVDPAGVGVAHNDNAARPNEPATVAAMPEGRRGEADIDLGAGAGIAEGSLGDSHRLVHDETAAPRLPRGQRRHRRQGRVEAQCQCGALRRHSRIGKDPEAARIALDRVEQQRRAFRQAGGDFGDAADLPSGSAPSIRRSTPNSPTRVMNSRKSPYSNGIGVSS
jgi:hypothetical protein